jgi:type I restriction enzyme M protein
MNNRNSKLDIATLESWLWEAACKIRGDIDAPKYKDYILPLIFLKRLSDVFEDEVNKLAESYSDTDLAKQLVDEDHGLVRVYLPTKARWLAVAKQTTGLGEYLTDSVRSIARENPKLQGVIDVVDFNARAAGQPIIGNDKLRALIDVLGRHRLGLQDVEPDILGRAYEYLLRKFAEGSGQSAGEFYTPREVGILMSYILDPTQGQDIYDPCCGSAGLLIKCCLRFKDKYGEDPSIDFPKFFGQEILHSTFAMARMNAFIHDMEADIRLGDTMNRPAFLNDDGSLKKFDIVTANPMWNQDFSQEVYENDSYNRFASGYPPSSSADWGWIQHMYTSLRDVGKMAIVIDTGAVSRGSGSVGRNRERGIRKEFVDKDLIEAVILMPENMFYNTPSQGIILVINKAKRNPGDMLLINASNLFEKGRPKNFLPNSSIEQISDLYLNWKEADGISRVITREEAFRNDYNLSPSRYVVQNGKDDTLPLDDAVVQLKETEEERKEADDKLRDALNQLGITL